MQRLNEQDLQRVYTWVDEIPLSRPKRNIARDFSDGVLVAEIVAYYFASVANMSHMFSPANSRQAKLEQWTLLNNKVLKRFNYQVPRAQMEAVVSCQPGAIEVVLKTLQTKMARYKARKAGAQPVGGGGGGGVGRGTPQGSMDSVGSPGSSVMGGGSVGPGPAGAAAAAAAVGGGGGAAVGGGELPRTDSFRDHAQEQLSHAADLQSENQQLREYIAGLELKTRKLEQLVRLKDSKIQAMAAKISALTAQE